ncbi:PP2C family protein-serine/threonine phosphatase, partial [candidate division KSB1 bacterium]
ASLFRLSSVLPTMLQFEKLLQVITLQSLDVVEADSAWLMMDSGEQEKYELLAASNMNVSLKRMVISAPFEEVIRRISRDHKAVIIDVLQNIKEMPIDKQIRKSGCSLIGVPLITAKNKVVGILFAFKAVNYAFDQEDSEMMQAFANQTTVAIENSKLLGESLEKERLQHEFNVARDIQLKMLPKEIPHIADNIHIEAVSIPAHEVGGDYFDFIQLDGNKWGVYIGDVSGKSLSAALYMGVIKGIIQSLAHIYHSPGELLKKVNETLYANIDRRSFITFLAGTIDLKKKKFVFTRAGHTPLAWYNPDRSAWELVQPKGLGLGLDHGPIFNDIIEEVEIPLKKGTIILLYTDGVTEVFNRAGDIYGEDRLLEVLTLCQDKKVVSYTDTVIEEIDTFSRQTKPDDITLVVMRFE